MTPNYALERLVSGTPVAPVGQPFARSAALGVPGALFATRRRRRRDCAREGTLGSAFEITISR